MHGCRSVLGNGMLCRQGATGSVAVDAAQQVLPPCSPAQVAQAPAGPVFPVMPVATATPGAASRVLRGCPAFGRLTAA